jgi:hypothetical protein
MQTKEQPDFGTLLRYYRKTTTDKDGYRGGSLSQERLAELLYEKTGQQFHRNKIEKWEKGQSFIHHQDERNVLVGLIGILHDYWGIKTLDEANRFLEVGGYRALNAEEISNIDTLWIPVEDKETSDTDPKSSQASMKDVMIEYLRRIPESDIVKNTGKVLEELFADRPGSETAASVQLHSTDCGNKPVNLARQRLLVSSAFGSYFTGLLEQENLYLDLGAQIDCPAPKNQAGLQPLHRIFWLLEYAGGPRTVIIGGEGGMGKSTLAAKIIRCLYQEQAVDLILGDSAKNEYVDPETKAILPIHSKEYDPASFYQRICEQLGLPAISGSKAIGAIRDRLLGRRAIIVVDNLETISKGNEIVETLEAITSRDVRAIVTTRQVSGLKPLDANRFVVQLRPLTETGVARQFLLWHISRYQSQHYALRNLTSDLIQEIKIEWLIGKTGGIPLLMQLVLSDVAMFSWSYVQSLPSLFGKDLLDFLYRTRWDDLGKLGSEGTTARKILKWIVEEQYRGQKITSRRLSDRAKELGDEIYLSAALVLLYERFLVLNREAENGDFSIYPSLSDFVSQQQI